MVKVYVRPATFGLLATDEKFLEHVLSSNKLIDKAKPYEYLNNWLGSGLLTSTGKNKKDTLNIKANGISAKLF